MTRVAPAPSETPAAAEPELAAAPGPDGGAATATVAPEDNHDEDHAAEMEKIRRMRGRGKRSGVSSDTSSAADDENYVPKYFPKTEEQPVPPAREPHSPAAADRWPPFPPHAFFPWMLTQIALP